MDHSAFLASVRGYVAQHPEVAAYISDHVAAGINKSRTEVLERAADMECALSMSLAKRFKGNEGFILDKLEKWKDKSSLNWQSTIEQLKGRP